METLLFEIDQSWSELEHGFHHRSYRVHIHERDALGKVAVSIERGLQETNPSSKYVKEEKQPTEHPLKRWCDTWQHWSRKSSDSQERFWTSTPFTHETECFRLCNRVLIQQLPPSMLNGFAHLPIDQKIFTVVHLALQQTWAHKEQLLASTRLWLHNIAVVLAARAPWPLKIRLNLLFTLYRCARTIDGLGNLDLDDSQSHGLTHDCSVRPQKYESELASARCHAGMRVLFRRLTANGEYKQLHHSVVQTVSETLWIDYIRMRGALASPTAFVALEQHLALHWADNKLISSLCLSDSAKWNARNINMLTAAHTQVGHGLRRAPATNGLSCLFGYTRQLWLAMVVFRTARQKLPCHKVFYLWWPVVHAFLVAAGRPSDQVSRTLQRWQKTFRGPNLTWFDSSDATKQGKFAEYIRSPSVTSTLFHHIRVCYHMVHWDSITSIAQWIRAHRLFLPLLFSHPLVCRLVQLFHRS